MGQATEQIERHIAAERQKLGQDLRQIEHQVNARLGWLRRMGTIGMGVALSSVVVALVFRLLRRPSRRSWRRLHR